MERNQSGLSAESACVCLRAVQIEKPFICTIHLSSSIVFFSSAFAHLRFCSIIFWFFRCILFFAYLLSFIPNTHSHTHKKPFGHNDFVSFSLPFSKVCSASDGSQCRHSSPKRRKLFPCPSSWPSTGKTNCDENVLPNKSVMFRTTSSRWFSLFRLIECAKASLKINYANYNCEHRAFFSLYVIKQAAAVTTIRKRASKRENEGKNVELASFLPTYFFSSDFLPHFRCYYCHYYSIFIIIVVVAVTAASNEDGTAEKKLNGTNQQRMILAFILISFKLKRKIRGIYISNVNGSFFRSFGLCSLNFWG